MGRKRIARFENGKCTAFEKGDTGLCKFYTGPKKPIRTCTDDCSCKHEEPVSKRRRPTASEANKGYYEDWGGGY